MNPALPVLNKNADFSGNLHLAKTLNTSFAYNESVFINEGSEVNVRARARMGMAAAWLGLAASDVGAVFRLWISGLRVSVFPDPRRSGTLLDVLRRLFPSIFLLLPLIRLA